jgi:hypothetical protein
MASSAESREARALRAVSLLAVLGLGCRDELHGDRDRLRILACFVKFQAALVDRLQFRWMLLRLGPREPQAKYKSK